MGYLVVSKLQWSTEMDNILFIDNARQDEIETFYEVSTYEHEQCISGLVTVS